MRGPRIQVSVLDAVPDGHVGRSAYSSFTHQSDSLRYFTGDARWSSYLLAAFIDEKVMGSLAIHRQAFPTTGDPMSLAAQAAAGDAWPSAEGLLYCVSPQRLIGGAASRVHPDRLTTELVLQAVFEEAAVFAEEQSLVPIALFTPGDQIPAVLAAWPEAGPPQLVDFDHHLDIRQGATFESFLEELSSTHRKTWNRDRRRLESKAIRAEPETVDSALLDELCPLIAAVQSNNGQPLGLELNRLRMRRLLKAEPGERVVFAVREPSGQLIAGALGRVVDDTLQVREIGMPAMHEDRADLYIAAGYYYPTQWAIERQLRLVEFGRGHTYPKAARGSRQIPLWHVLGGRRGTRYVGSGHASLRGSC